MKNYASLVLPDGFVIKIEQMRSAHGPIGIDIHLYDDPFDIPVAGIHIESGYVAAVTQLMHEVLALETKESA